MIKEAVAGIDIGATNTVIGLVDASGQCFTKSILKTDQYPAPVDFATAMAGCIHEMAQTHDPRISLTGIGIGAPNGNIKNGCIERAANLRWKDQIPLASLVQYHFSDIPVRLTNDANAAALGEMIFGAARGMKDFIMITLGTGLGSGVVANGQLVYGHDGFAGELGHVIVDPGGRECGCGRRGCLETFVSATGITRTAKELLGVSSIPSLLRNIPGEEVTSRRIYEAALAGDGLALEAFDVTSRKLGASLADFVAFSSPEAIILFGGLAQAGALLFEPTKKYMEASLLSIYKDKVKLLPSQLPENDAAILGAAALVMQSAVK